MGHSLLGFFFKKVFPFIEKITIIYPYSPSIVTSLSPPGVSYVSMFQHKILDCISGDWPVFPVLHLSSWLPFLQVPTQLSFGFYNLICFEFSFSNILT